MKTIIGAKRVATRERYQKIYYDFTIGEWDACPAGQPQGHFEAGRFIEHRCRYYPAGWPARQIEEDFQNA